MATHSSICAWRMPWTEEPVGLQSGGHTVRPDWSDLACSMHARCICLSVSSMRRQAQRGAGKIEQGAAKLTQVSSFVSTVRALLTCLLPLLSHCTSHHSMAVITFVSTCGQQVRLLCLFIFIYFLMYFLAALGLHCCTWAFSSCGEWGPLFVVGNRLHSGGFSHCGARSLECGFSSCGTWA